MEERARELGARLKLNSAPGSGTKVTLEVARDGH
jgi:signal transduction histidine kinase